MTGNMILDGLIASCSILNLLLVFTGTLLGVIIGALPGLGPSLGIALLIPLSYGMDRVTALMLMGGIYVGSIYGGSITAILLGIPGTPNSTATVLDGFPMARQGKSLEALAASTVGSSFGGVAGALCLMFLTPVVSQFVLSFGVAEQFMLAIFGLSVIAIASKETFLKGLLGGFFGLALATIGYDPITGLERFTFGSMWLSDGVPFMVVVIGVFGIAQTIALAESAIAISQTEKLSGSIWEGVRDVFKHFGITVKATLMGLFFGAVPGVGGGPTNMIAYTTITSNEKDSDTFGKGNVKGVLVAEVSNNATVGTALIPTLAFGIPGSTAAAVVLGLMTMHGIETGPNLFVKMPLDLYTFFWGLIFTNIALSIICLPLLKYFAKVTLVPYQFIVPNIVIMCVLGVYGLRRSFFDVFLAILFGVFGYFLRKAKFPMVGIILGSVLGKAAEANLSRSLLVHKSWSFVYTRPITFAILILTLIIIALPYIDLKKLINKLRGRSQQ
jgi:putative tricarboxylic transport membrane protein